MTLPLPPSETPPDTDNRRRRRIALALFALLAAGAGYWRYAVTRPDHRLARGEAAIREKNWDAAEQLAARLDEGGHADHASVLRGEVLMARGRPDQALAALNRVKPEGKLRLRAAVASGKCLLAMKQFREAYRVFLVVVEEDPNSIDAHRGLAAAAYDMGQLSVAGTHLQRVAELDPADARPHRLVGLIHKDLSQWPEAAEAYREALRRGLPVATRGEVRLELAQVLLHQGDFAAASTELTAAVTDGGEALATPDYFAMGAECQRGLGRKDQAVVTVNRGLERTPSARLFRLRGQLLLDDARHTDAIPPLEEAVKLAPADFEARFLLAQAYAAVGRKDDAGREFARVDELKKDFTKLTDLSREAMEKPWDAGVRLRLAEVCDKLGKPELAAMWRSAAAAGQGR